MRHFAAIGFLVLVGLIAIPQTGGAQPAYNRSVDTLSVYPYTGPLPKAVASTQTVGTSPYMIAATGAFSVADNLSHDLSSRLTIYADGIVLAEYTAVIDKEGSQCGAASPPNCQSQTSCGPIIIGSQLPYNWLGISFQGCCQIWGGSSYYCGCCTIYEEATAAAFGPFNLEPGSQIEVRIDSYSTGEAEIYTADDSKFATVASVVPASSMKMTLSLMLIVLGVGTLAVIRQRRRALV